MLPNFDFLLLNAFKPLFHLQNLNPNPNPQTIALPGYKQWSSAQVRTEIARAGYRLAGILKKIWP